MSFHDNIVRKIHAAKQEAVEPDALLIPFDQIDELSRVLEFGKYKEIKDGEEFDGIKYCNLQVCMYAGKEIRVAKIFQEKIQDKIQDKNQEQPPEKT